MQSHKRYNSKELWNSFIASFRRNLHEIKSERSLGNILKDRFTMTSFYKNELFPKIANDLELESDATEYLRIDIMLFQKGENGFHVPMIFVESENDSIGDLDREIHKLLCVNSPLKVLLTRLHLDPQISAKYENHEDTYWYYVLQDFAKFGRLTGYFAVIAAHWKDSKLVYSYIAYDEEGEPVANKVEDVILN